MHRNGFLDFVETISKIIGFLSGCSAALILFMTLIITGDVIGRSLFGLPIYFSTEVSGYILVALTFLGLAYTQRKGKHIRIQLLTHHLPEHYQRYLDVVVLIIGIIIVGWLTWATKDPVIQNYVFHRKSITSLETPMWIPWLLVPVGFFMLTVEYIAEFLKTVCSRSRQGEQKDSGFDKTV